MAKTKTLTKREKSLKEKKGKATATPFNPSEGLDIHGLKEAMIQSLLEGDEEAFKDCVYALITLYDWKDITEETGITKTTLYRMFKEDSNPTLSNIAKVLSYMNDKAS